MVLNLDIAVVLEREDGDGDGEGVVNVGFAGLRIGSETCGEGDVEEEVVKGARQATLTQRSPRNVKIER